MKKTVLFATLLISSLFVTAQLPPAKKGSSYGAMVNTSGAISVEQLAQKLATENQFTGKVRGTVSGVCQEKGCWIKLTRADSDPIMIRFKDYKFFVPKDIDGKEVVLSGTAKKTVTSVEMLKHYALDAGKSKEEIDAITTPKNEITFIASGVLVD